MERKDRVPENGGYKGKESTCVVLDDSQGGGRQLIPPTLEVQLPPPTAEGQTSTAHISLLKSASNGPGFFGLF